MTKECERLLSAALKSVGLGGSFDPAEMGAKVGLNRAQAELAARSLSNAGVLDLGFDLAAHFTSGFRKSRAPVEVKVKGEKVKTSVKGKKKRAKAVAV